MTRSLPSRFTKQSNLPNHAAIIMDGNGRWAQARGLPRIAGHRAGAQALRRVIEQAPEVGIQTLTLFAFSADNWHRPHEEVAALMQLLAWRLRSEAKECAREGVRLSMIGRRDRLPQSVLQAAAFAEEETRNGAGLHLRLAIDYSARESIQLAFRNSSALKPPLGDDVDLLIRTGGEQRLSDFLLWECAYAELFFSPRMWPDFRPEDLRAAVAAFQSRQRRFGRVPMECGVPPATLGQSWEQDGAGTFCNVRRDRWLR